MRKLKKEGLKSKKLKVSRFKKVKAGNVLYNIYT